MTENDGDEYTPLEHQVAGHPSTVLASRSGETIIKPSLPLEIAFYAETAPACFPELVGRWIPRFDGVQDHASLPKQGKAQIQQVRSYSQ